MKVTINGKDARQTWGLTLDQKGLSALLTPPGAKENVKNSARTMHGTQVFRDNPRMAARTISLPMQFKAKTEDQFWQRYLSFCEELKGGFVDISTDLQEGVTYHLEYNSCTQFMEYNRGLAKFTLKLTENDPSDRS